MAHRLARIAESADARRNPYESSLVVQALSSSPPPAELRARLTHHANLARALLHAGRTGEAIERFREVLTEIDDRGEQVPLQFTLAVRDFLAISYLQLGQQQNCVPPYATVRCRVPHGAEGRYTLTEGPRAAVGEYQRLLEAESDNLVAQWFLNISHMTLGDHPAGVPKEWLIPEAAFTSEYDVTRFRDIAPELNLDILGRAGGSIVDDFDGDGLLDLFASSRGLTDQLRYYRNNGDGSFAERSAEAGLTGLVGGLNLVHADYNNDGYLDVFVLRGAWLLDGHPNSLLRNNGDGTFSDVTEEAGLLAPPFPTQTASWGDYNSDGWIDLLVGNETQGAVRNPSQLFRNNGDGTFTDVAAEAGVAVVGLIKAVVWGDIDNDRRPDLYVSRLDGPNVLLRNAGPDDTGRWKFTDLSRAAGVVEPVESFPAWMWDYDNDGWLDIFVSGRRGNTGDVAAEYLGMPHRAEVPRLYRNKGDGTFDDVTASTRVNRVMLAMGSNYGDLDNDGYPDFYVGTGDPDFRALVPNRMFRNASGRHFQDVTTSGGFGLLPRGHGVAFGDLDNDGDQDFYAVMGGGYEGDVAHNVLFENPGHGNRWITLKLEGVRTNRAAIGARIKITVDTPQGPRDIYSTVSSGGSFGANSLQQELGLGAATSIRSVAITWPVTGLTDRYTDLQLHKIYRIREGDPEPTLVELQQLRLGGRAEGR